MTIVNFNPSQTTNKQEPPKQAPRIPHNVSPDTPRRFPDFLSAFEAYANDGYTPPDFNTWTGLAIAAAALERKVWFQWNQTLFFYPNLFVMLVSLPAQGKSTALNRGVDLLRELGKTGHIKFLPNQASEAYFNECVGKSKDFFVSGGQQHLHTSAFFYASEASDSLKEIYGDITSTMTNLYDCPRNWKKGTKKDGDLIVENGCLNFLAGATFEFLGKLITDSNIMGGFASRLTYIVAPDEKLRPSSFPHGYQDLDGLKRVVEDNLIFDLRRINEMSGCFSATKEFGEAWQVWDQASQKRRYGSGSEKMKSLLARNGTTLMKLCMVISACESSAMVLEERHFRRAEALLAETERQLPAIFRMARAGNVTSADGLRNAIMLLMVNSGTITREELTRLLIFRGFETMKIQIAIDGALRNKILGESSGKLRLLVNPNEHL